LLFSPAFVIAYFYKRQLAKNAAAKIAANLQKKRAKSRVSADFFSTSVNFVLPGLLNRLTDS